VPTLAAKGLMPQLLYLRCSRPCTPNRVADRVAWGHRHVPWLSVHARDGQGHRGLVAWPHTYAIKLGDLIWFRAYTGW